MATYQYDPFGAIRSQTGSVANPYRFTGREYDAESGLHSYRARYYEVETGRFTTRDIFRGDLFAPLSQNRYGYVEGNPISWKDPLGMKPRYGNFLGPGNYGYDKEGIDAVDRAAKQHDIAYEKEGASGTMSAITDFRDSIIAADLTLASEAFTSLWEGTNASLVGDLWAEGAGVFFGVKGVVGATISFWGEQLRGAGEDIGNILWFLSLGLIGGNQGGTQGNGGGGASPTAVTLHSFTARSPAAVAWPAPALVVLAALATLSLLSWQQRLRR